MGYKTCPCCGAHLDPGETCDCRKETAALQQEDIPDENGSTGKSEHKQ